MLKDGIQTDDVSEIYELESSLIPNLIDMRRKGVRIDTDKAQEVKNVRAAAKKSAKATSETKTTLGDTNEALQALKDKMNS